jgi:hypothetical protein
VGGVLTWQDAHWEVRSAACVAAGQTAAAFPQETMSCLSALTAGCFKNLGDQCWSIREDSAVALGRVAKGLRDVMVPMLVARLRATIKEARKQPVKSQEEYARQVNDVAAHTGKAIFGCCGGKDTSSPCEQHRYRRRQTAPHWNAPAHRRPVLFHRAPQPWELSDGAVYLLRELCHEDVRPDGLAEEFLPVLAELASLDHFPEADRLRQTIFDCLPDVGRSLGKRVFKRHLDLFLAPLITTLTGRCASLLAQHSAKACLDSLSELVGPSIFLGRLSEHDRYLYTMASERHDVQTASPSVAQTFPELRTRPSLVSI